MFANRFRRIKIFPLSRSGRFITARKFAIAFSVFKPCAFAVYGCNLILLANVCEDLLFFNDSLSAWFEAFGVRKIFGF